jgi:hypothetical protein
MMTDINKIATRIDTPVLGNSAPRSASALQPPDNASRKPGLQQLRSLRIPPSNHPDFEIPSLSAADKNARMAELDTLLYFLRSDYSPGCDDRAAEAVHQHHLESQKVTREAVLAFMNDGLCPSEPNEFQALVLFLVKNKLPDALSWLVVQTGVGMLDLHHCDLDAQEMGMLADWARNIPFQIGLDLSGNHIDSDGAALLADALSANTIIYLELGNNPLTDKGVQALGMALRGNTSLQSLLLHHTGLQNPGIEVLASVLDTHPALAVLVVDGNPFDDQGAASLAIALGKNKTLLRLAIRFSQLSDIGLAYLADALAINTRLKSLQLSCKSDKEFVHFPYALADALLVNQTLTHLLVFADSIPEAATRQLAAAVAVNTTLRDFELALGAYRLSEANAAMASQMSEKVQANALIEKAGLTLSELSQLPEWSVPIPTEIGHQIAAFAAQVAEDDRRRETLQAMAGAGPLGAAGPGDETEPKTGGD